MSSLQVPPQNLIQREILSVVEKLRKDDITPFAIYEIICSRFPMMEDTDIYFLDLLLGYEHLGRKKAGGCIVSDLRMCLGKDENDFYDGEGAGATFVKHTREQFCDNDMFSTGRGYASAAVKLVNPLYGSAPSTAQFCIVLEVKPENSRQKIEVFSQECEVELNQFEYTHIEYIPMLELFSVQELKDMEFGCMEMFLKICRTDTEETIMCKQLDYVSMGLPVASNFTLLEDESEFYFTNLMTTNLVLKVQNLKTLNEFWLPKMQIGVRIETLGEQIPRTVYFNHICLDRDIDNIYVFMGKLFGELSGHNGVLFEEGEYRVFFTYMECELFHTKIDCIYDQIGLGLGSGTFVTAAELGKAEDKGHRTDAADTPDDADIDDAQGSSDSGDAAEADDSDDFDKLLDDFISRSIKGFGNGPEDESKKVEVRKVAMCSTDDPCRRELHDSNFFFMRDTDEMFYVMAVVKNPGVSYGGVCADGVEIECTCRETGGSHSVPFEGEVEGGKLYVAVLFEDLSLQRGNPADKFVFDVVVKQFGEELYRKEITAFVIKHVFDVISLESIDLLDTSDKENASEALPMSGFQHGKLQTLTAMFSISAPVELENMHFWTSCDIKGPDGDEWTEDVDQLQMQTNEAGDKFTAFYSAEFERYHPDDWIKGRYELKFILTDASDARVDLAKIYFTVGDWNDEGVYDADVVMRQMKQDEDTAVDTTSGAAGKPSGTAGKPASALEKLESLIGLEEVKKEISDLRKQLELALKRKEMGLPADMPFLHARFYGNPGTGKTTVAKLLGEAYKEAGLLSSGHVVFAERKNLIAGRFYDSVNKATMEAVDKAQGGILFIDEAYNLFVADDGKDPGRDVIDSLLTVLADDSKKDWMLILAGYPQEMENMVNMNKGFRSRVPNVFHFADYDASQLMQIAELYCRQHVYTLAEDAKVQLQNVISKAYAGRSRNFENARYVVNLIETVILKKMGQRLNGITKPTREQLTTIIAEDIPSITTIKESKKLEKFRQMVGMGQLKESIQSHLNYVKLCNNRMRVGLSTQMPQLHMVFAGNPGTGKTTVADFIGEIYASMGILTEGNVIKVTKKDLVGVHVGETERKMNQVLERARGNVLFIDEAYELDPKSDPNGAGKAVLDALVDELGGDHVDMIVILAGYPQEMKQLLEYNTGLESRFPNVFHFNDYSVEELLKIALQSGAAKDFVFTAKAKERLEAYIRREVLRKQKSFGNGRFVTRLITNTILPKMATRLASVENPTVKQLKTIMADDIPITAEQVRSVNDTGFDEKLIAQSLAKLDAMAGLDKVKQAIHNFVDIARYRNSIGEKFVGSNVLKWSFVGNTGTGKSTVAKIFADILKGMNLLAKGNFVEVKGEQIFNVSEYTCDQVLKSAVDRSRYGVLFIDGDAPEFRERGVYALTNEQLKIKLSQLTTEMGGAGAIIVAECDARRQSLVSSLAHSGVYEFDHTIVFDDYSADELFEILRQCLAGHKVKFTSAAEEKMRSYISGMLSDKGPQLANARTMKLLSRTIYEIVMLRESRNASSPRRTVMDEDVAKFEWNSHRKRIGY